MTVQKGFSASGKNRKSAQDMTRHDIRDQRGFNGKSEAESPLADWIEEAGLASTTGKKMNTTGCITLTSEFSPMIW